MLEPGAKPEYFKAKLNTQMVEMMGSWVDIINVWSPEIVEDERSKTVSLEVGPIGCKAGRLSPEAVWAVLVGQPWDSL